MNRAELIEGLKDRLLQVNVEQIALKGLIEIYKKETPSKSSIPPILPTSEDFEGVVGGLQRMKDEVFDEVTTKAGIGKSAQDELAERILWATAPRAPRAPKVGPRKYDWDAIKVIYDSGVTIRSMAEKFDMPESTISTHAHRNGWKKRYKKWEPQQKPAPGKKGVKKGEAFWDCIRHDWENSTDSIRQIGRDSAVAESAIHYHAKKEKWGPRPKKDDKRPKVANMVKCPSCGLAVDGRNIACNQCHVVLPTGVRI